MSLWTKIADEIAATTGQPFSARSERSVGGGCINAASVLEGDGRKYFIKLNRASGLEMFAAEAAGLQELSKAHAVRVPRPVCWGAAEGSAYLAMEYLELSGGGRGGLELLGQQLAKMHRFAGDKYGWQRDNTIGSTPQINTPSDDWVAFWRRHRLGFQLEFAAQNGYTGRLQHGGAQLLEEVGAFFTTYKPLPSLLHGDLWSGNYAVNSQSNPVIFDPAVYYGDREADLAMTELFGGFGSRFYDAYRDAYPLDPGYRVRKTLYNLYHIINHVNLFGGGYLGQAERMIGSLLSEIR